MGLFRYEAVDKSGKVLHGAMNAASEQQVAQALAQRGYTLRAIIAGGNHGTAQAAPPPQRTGSMPSASTGIAAVTVASGVPVSVKSAVPSRHLAMFFRQIITLVRSGIPVYQSFHDVALSTRHGHLRSVLPQVQKNLETGQSLSSAMAQLPHVFPVHATASVWAGEMAGKLDVALEEVAVGFEQEASDTRYGRIGWGMAKINLVFFLFVIWAANLENLAGPTIIAAIKSNTTDKAAIVASLARSYAQMALSKSIPLAAILIILWISWGYIKRVATVRRLLDSMLLGIPVWGNIHRCRALARFLHVLEQMIEAGLSPAAAWDAASLTPRNSAVAEKLKLAKNSVSGSAGFAEMLSVTGLFQQEDVGLVVAGEKGGQLPSSLANLSALYLDQADALRPVGRTLSISLLTASMIALSGWVVIKMVTGYFDLLFGVGEKLISI